MDLTIDSADVIRLIQAHLTECGLHEACKSLREESGIKAAGASHSQWRSFASIGDWGWVLSNLATIDMARIPDTLLSAVHEMSILELADLGDFQLAYATLRLVTSQLDCLLVNEVAPESIPKSRHLEQRLVQHHDGCVAVDPLNGGDFAGHPVQR